MERKRIIKKKTRYVQPPVVDAPLTKGCTIHEVGSPRKHGRITALGAEVSEVTFPEQLPRFINNARLVNLGKDSNDDA